jgi:hypothetical protein
MKSMFSLLRKFSKVMNWYIQLEFTKSGKISPILIVCNCTKFHDIPILESRNSTSNTVKSVSWLSIYKLICLYLLLSNMRISLYNNPSTHFPNTLYDAGMQYPRKLGQGHIGLGRVDIEPFVLATAEIDSRPQTYLHRPRLFGLAWLAADEKKLSTWTGTDRKQVHRRLCITVLLFFRIREYCRDPPPFPVWISTGVGIHHTVCNGRGDRVVWRANTGIIHCVFDQIPNQLNCFTTPNKNLGRGPQTDKHLPPSTFTGHFFKKSPHLGFVVFIYIWSLLWVICTLSTAPNYFLTI